MHTENELSRRALGIVSDAQLGIFMTCDGRGYPHGRWMHVLPLQGLQRLYSLTAIGTRKLRHISGCSEVSWLVSSGEEDVVLLKGLAEVHTNFSETREIWDRLAPCAQRYAVGPLSDDEHMELITIQTTVQYAELICPSWGLGVPREVRLTHPEQ